MHLLPKKNNPPNLKERPSPATENNSSHKQKRNSSAGEGQHVSLSHSLFKI